MVRVISVHHFAEQDVKTVEQPTACTVAPPDRLLLSLTSNVVEVRDLNNNSQVLFSFPTVDEVLQMSHCLNGDYVLTLESKFNRQNKGINFIRVYINWDSIATLQQSKMTSSGASLDSTECGMVQPMRARIAGRVTPTTNQSELGSLEMIEIPVRENPNIVQCCQISGNIIVVSNHIVTFYEFKMKSHDISRMKFVDFEEVPIYIELTFFPSTVAFCENYVAAMNRDCMHLFRIVRKQTKDRSSDSSAPSGDKLNYLCSQDEGIDYKKLVQEAKLNTKKRRVIVNLPSIVKSNSVIHKSSPFTFCDKDMVAVMRSRSPVKNIPQSYELQNLIHIGLIPIVLIDNLETCVTEEFKCLILKPLYINENLNKRDKDSKKESDRALLKSNFRKCFNGVSCVFTTQQEGYLYYFNDSELKFDGDNCIAVYPFTSPVCKLVMEDYFLHALTDTGLETYTLRLGHQLCRTFEVVDDIKVACPAVSEPVCLAGLKAFLGVEQILLSENHLILLANADNSPTHSVSSSGSSTTFYWTIYNLKLPGARAIFHDISMTASIHRFSSPVTYHHLMSESHMILRVALLLKKWTMLEDGVKLVVDSNANNDDIVEAYRNSCALIGDHFIMCQNEEDYKLSVPYYFMARLLPNDVLTRVKKIQEQHNVQSTKGLLYYLKSVLENIKFGPDADRYFSNGRQTNFAESILKILEKHHYDGLSNLILKSKILREYSTEKLINILNNRIIEKSEEQVEKYLALAILHIQKCNTRDAEITINNIPSDSLFEMLNDNWELLFEATYTSSAKMLTTFSELAIVLFSTNPDLLCKLFVHLVITKKVITLCKLIKVFLEYLPSSIGSDSNTASTVLQKTLELYFQQYFSKPENADLSDVIYERGTNEAMKLLVRSYLSQLQILQLKESNMKDNKNDKDLKSKTNYEKEIRFEDDDTEKDRQQEKFSYKHVDKTFFQDSAHEKSNNSYLFSDRRYEYLDKMPPFQLEITSMLYRACIVNYPIKSESLQDCEEADLVLKKLQALLSSRIVPKQLLNEITSFLAMNENLRGCVSLLSITMSTEEAILLLLDECPQCLLQFGKDRFTKAEEWKFLIRNIQQRIIKLSQDENLNRVCFFHKKLLKDTLTYVARTMPIEELCQVFPQHQSTSSPDYVDSQNKVNSDSDSSSTPLKIISKIEDVEDNCKYTEKDLDILNEIQNYEPYITICKETTHANEIHKLIVATGQQLLSTLNL